PDVKESITVPASGSDETRLTLSFGAGTLKLSPGAKNLVDGTAVYNFPEFKPEIINEDGGVEIKHEDFKNLINPNDIKNEWDLQLGKTPIDLNINAGAYEGRYELGGLSLTGLTVKDGAADVELSFSEPNKTEMSVLRYETGASSVTLSGLANANFSTLIFSGGAGSYELDFGGELKDDAIVRIESGAGNVQLIIPKDVDAEVTVESALVNIDHSSGWSQNGNDYTQKGDGPTLTIIIKMAAGNLTITD
ncbi:MAG TPA: toast rack family protein, partial [Anaerolineales bacterium]|nr:toast rack family protein [Anaerolineales bacterium]